jgi:hypothetical protein
VTTVVFDDEAATILLRDEEQAARGGAGVADDVGDGFAEGEGQCDFFGGSEVSRAGDRCLEDKGDACGIEGEASSFNLGAEAAGAVASDALRTTTERV